MSERRALLILVDLTRVTLAVLFAPWVQALRAVRPFTWVRIVCEDKWLLFLPALWLLLAVLNGFHNPCLASSLGSNWGALVRMPGLLL